MNTGQTTGYGLEWKSEPSMACYHFERLAADGCGCKIESDAADQHERVLWWGYFVLILAC